MKEIRRGIKRGLAVCGTALMGASGYVRAAELDEVTKPFKNLETLLTTITTAIGGVWLIIAIFQFAFAFHQNDPQGKQSAIKGIVTAAILLSIGVVLSFVRS